MRILISGGGTGGHINPALAIAGYIRQKDPQAIIEYVGTTHGLETKLVPREGYPIHYVNVNGFSRKLTLKNIKAALHAVTSVFEAKKIIKRFRPDVVIGTGGYVCWPVLKAASAMGIPTAIHEQNAYPGLTVRKLARYVDSVMISFRESETYFPSGTPLAFVGNPVKPEMLTLAKETERQTLGIPLDATVVLSYGGSLGAKRVNETVASCICDFSLPKGITHIHATGEREWELYRERFTADGFTQAEDGVIRKENVTIRRYIYNMPSLLAAADVVICRAGAMTLSELAIMGKASVIIPSPNVTNDHQYKNAKVLADAGAAHVIRESELSDASLIAAVKELVDLSEKRKDMQNRVREFAIPDSLARIYAEVRRICKTK